MIYTAVCRFMCERVTASLCAESDFETDSLRFQRECIQSRGKRPLCKSRLLFVSLHVRARVSNEKHNSRFFINKTRLLLRGNILTQKEGWKQADISALFKTVILKGTT